MNKLFEKTPGGLLVEVGQAARATRRFSTVVITIDILFTAEEEAARDAEEDQAAITTDRVRQDVGQRLQAAQAKLDKLGLTRHDLRTLLQQA